MKNSAYGKPMLIEKGVSQLLDRIEDVSEIMIQDLVFENPECLPISDIDEAYNPAIPVCKELRTPVGPLDILMVTANGDLVVIETKLWRNPEARRKVVAQILDYATELSKWTYEDLQREINRNLRLKGNSLYEIAKRGGDYFTLNEADFVDTVSRNLARGKFLLMIVGDGIKEGAASITDFLSSSAHMSFTFGMVELTVYTISEGRRIVIPKTITKTTEIQKINFDFPSGVKIVFPDSRLTVEPKTEPKNIEQDKRRSFFTEFWAELVDQMDLDDPGQALPKATTHQNIYLYPYKTKNAWISAYFMQSNKRVGVYFRFSNDQKGHEMADYLNQYKAEILNELNSNEVWWSADTNSVEGFGVRMPIEDVYANENREKIKEFFRNWINQFVNVIRPRLKNFKD